MEEAVGGPASDAKRGGVVSQGGEEWRRERWGGASGAGELCSIMTMACESVRDRAREGAKGESELDRARRSGSGSPYRRVWARWLSCKRAREARDSDALPLVGHDALLLKVSIWFKID